MADCPAYTLADPDERFYSLRFPPFAGQVMSFGSRIWLLRLMIRNLFTKTKFHIFVDDFRIWQWEYLYQVFKSGQCIAVMLATAVKPFIPIHTGIHEPAWPAFEKKR